MLWEPAAPKPGEQAFDLLLLDETGKPTEISALARGGPLLALVFRGPDDQAGLSMLRQYRDLTLALRRAGVSVCGIAHAEPSALRFMREERGLGFPLLSDADGTALSHWGMLDRTGFFLLAADLKVKLRALGSRDSADALLTFVRRGGTRPLRFRDRLAHLLHALSHALRPRRLAR